MPAYRTSTLLLVVLLLGGCDGEVFTSSHHLSRMFLVEKDVIQALQHYLVKAETRLGRIRRYIQEYEAVRTDAGWTTADKLPSLSTSGLADFVQDEDEGNSTSSRDVSGLMKTQDQTGGIENLSGNPLHAFHLMKRMTVYWKHIDADVLKDEWDGVLRALYGEKGAAAPHTTLPDDGDLQGAAQALVRLQHVYGLNISEVAEGRVQGVSTSAVLTSQDCLYLGKHAYNLGHLQQAVDWFWHAHHLAGQENNMTVTQEQVASFLNTAINSLEKAQTLEEEHSHPKTFTTKIDSTAATEENLQDSWKTTEELNTHESDKLPHGFQYYSAYQDEENFFSLCRGEKVLSPEAEAHLLCHYGSAEGPTAPLAPYLTLMPPKVEIQHPGAARLVTFHGVLSDAEIDEIKRLADPMLSRAMVQGLEGLGNTVSSTRTSKVAWLDDSLHPLAERLNKRVGLLTGLSTDVLSRHSEMLQVANYGMGGHYNPHHDYLLVDKSPHELKNIDPRELEMGDRVATFMFYLSDVTRGGATAFPRLGVAVSPIRGTAAFWYNLHRSGDLNENTLHGACPVLLGSKWVSNKWIRERGQFRRRPCELQP